ncbi:MAG: amidophosphoribosyltransferase, partial [Christensenellaceae bacterium]
MYFDSRYNYERIKPKDDVMAEECGVFGIYMDDNRYDPAEAAYLGLYALQHRGQESAGIATTNGKEMKYHKGMGLCSEVFKDNLDKILGGHIGIGHVRYSTTGDSLPSNAQPLVMSYRSGKLALSHNGNLINASILREKMENDGAIFQTTIDTEVMANLIAKYSKRGLVQAIASMMKVIRGSYALVLMTQDELVAVRDPLGIRPLALGKLD